MSDTAPSGADVEEIDSGVWSIRVPMPGHPLRASFCYAYVGDDGATTVIDPGWPTEHSWSELRGALQRIGSAPERTASILLTHAHRDHSGLAGRLAAASGATVALHRDDRALLARKGPEHQDRVRDWLAVVGVPHGEDGQATSLVPDLPQLPEQVRSDRCLEDGDIVPVASGELIVHWTPGHTPGHVCFQDVDRGLLFTGDHVLPRITPNISSMVGHSTSALSDYLRSLVKVGGLVVERALPGHEHAFSGVAARAAELIEHHRQRLEEILTLLARRSQRTTLEIARELTWSRRWEQITGLQQRAALGEVMSHLYFLHTIGAVRARTGDSPIVWSLSSSETLSEAWIRSAYDVAM